MRRVLMIIVMIALIILGAKMNLFDEASSLQKMSEYDAQMKADAVHFEQLKAEGIYPYEY